MTVCVAVVCTTYLRTQSRQSDEKREGGRGPLLFLLLFMRHLTKITEGKGGTDFMEHLEDCVNLIKLHIGLSYLNETFHMPEEVVFLQ